MLEIGKIFVNNHESLEPFLDLESKTELVVKDQNQPFPGVYLPIVYQKALLIVEYEGSRVRPARYPWRNYYKIIIVSTKVCKQLFVPDSKNSEGIAVFYLERDLDSLIKDNKRGDEWLNKKVQEIVGNSISQREIVDKLVRFVYKEVDYLHVSNEEIDKFARFLSGGFTQERDKLEGLIKNYFPYIKNRLIENIQKQRQIDKDETVADFCLQLVKEKFDNEINSYLKIYLKYNLNQKSSSAELLARDFLDTLGGEWVLFKMYMRDPERCDSINIIQNGGVCGQKAELLNALCQETSIPSVSIDGYYHEDFQHTWNAVKVDGIWEINDPTENKTQIRDSTYQVLVDLEGGLVRNAYSILVKKPIPGFYLEL